MKVTYLQSSLLDDLYEVADIPDGVEYRLERKDALWKDDTYVYWNSKGVIHWKHKTASISSSSTTWIKEAGHLYWARPI